MAFPTTSLLDDFTRADNASLGASWGANIFTGEPTCGIVSNKAQQSAAFKSNYWLTSFAADQEAWMTVAVLVSGGAPMRLHARIQSPAGPPSSYVITMYTAGDFYLEKYVAGTNTFLQTLGGAGTLANGHKVGMSVEGTTIKCYQDTGGGWAQVGTNQTDSSVSGAGYVGFDMGNGTGGTVDDFGGGNPATWVPKTQIL